MYMLDTNTCIYTIKRLPHTLRRRFRAADPAQVCISSVTLAELVYGAEKSRAVEANLAEVRNFVSHLQINPWTADCALRYGRVRADLERAGTPIGALDMLIAAHALTLGATLVTNNVREFERVRDLAIEDWTVS